MSGQERQPRIIQINTMVDQRNRLHLTVLTEDGQIAIGYEQMDGMVWKIPNLPTFDPMVQP